MPRAGLPPSSRSPSLVLVEDLVEVSDEFRDVDRVVRLALRGVLSPEQPAQ